MAFYLFWHVKPSWERAYIVQEDLAGFLPPDKAVGPTLRTALLCMPRVLNGCPGSGRAWGGPCAEG